MVTRIRKFLSIFVCILAFALIVVRWLWPETFTPEADRTQAIFATWFVFRYASEVAFVKDE